VNKLEPANDNFHYSATEGKFTFPDTKASGSTQATKTKKKAKRRAHLRLVYSARPRRK
jgi:hypothetical protein